MKIKHITEKRLKVVKASDPLPKLSKPTTGREQPHPYTGMLVGSKTNEKDDLGMYNQPSAISKNSHQRYVMKQFVRYAKDVIGFQTLDDLKKEENLDKVIAHMANDGIDLSEQKLSNFDGKFIDQDFMDLVKLMKGKGEGSVQELSSNLLGFLSWASNDPKYGKVSLAKFSDNMKIAYSQYNANQSFKQHEKDNEEYIKQFAMNKYSNQTEESLEYNSLEESVGKFITEEEFDQLAEKQDACYHKVKSRYKVWPSAYASGALVKCRKVGAKNWGNSSKKKKKKKKK